MIHAVIFDFGNVLCTFEIQHFLRRVSRHSKKSLPELQQLLPTFKDVGVQYESGVITSDGFFEEVRQRAALSIDKDEFIKAYCEIFTPIPSMFDLVRRLKRNYKLGLISNTNEWHYQYGIRPVAVFPLFDAVSLSFEVKAMKPARPIYDNMLAKLIVNPPECVYIDDIEENVDVAVALGMHGAHFSTPDKLVQSLRALDLVF